MPTGKALLPRLFRALLTHPLQLWALACITDPDPRFRQPTANPLASLAHLKCVASFALPRLALPCPGFVSPLLSFFPPLSSQRTYKSSSHSSLLFPSLPFPPPRAVVGGGWRGLWRGAGTTVLTAFLPAPLPQLGLPLLLRTRQMLMGA